MHCVLRSRVRPGFASGSPRDRRPQSDLADHRRPRPDRLAIHAARKGPTDRPGRALRPEFPTARDPCGPRSVQPEIRAARRPRSRPPAPAVPRRGRSAGEESTGKPDSVPVRCTGGGHLSGPGRCRPGSTRPTWRWAGHLVTRLLGLAPDGAPWPPLSPATPVCSYRTLSPLPRVPSEDLGHRSAVCSLLACPARSPAPGCYPASCPAESGLSSAAPACSRGHRGRLADSPPLW